MDSKISLKNSDIQAATAPKQPADAAKPTDNTADGKSKKDKTKLLIGSLIGLATIAATTVIAIKRHKNVAGDISTNLNKGTASLDDEIARLSGRKSSRVASQTAREPVAAKQVSKLQVYTDESLHPVLHVQYSDDVAKDLENWKKLYEAAPLTTKVEGEAAGSEIIINPKFKEFEITPHNYKNDTDVYIHAKDYTRDFSSYKLENGSMRSCSSLTNCTKEPCASYHIDISNKALQTGLLDDGRRYVSFALPTGEQDAVKRSSYRTVMLVSKDSDYTPVQKDAIRIFKTLGNQYDLRTAITPINFATIVPAGSGGNPTGDGHIFRTNRNALLSSISSWAKNSPEFEVDGFIKSAGEAFRV